MYCRRRAEVTINITSDRTAAAITETPLSADEHRAAVDLPTAGATVVFSGVVRDHDHGHGVVELEYVAHPSAIDVLRAVSAPHRAEAFAAAQRLVDDVKARLPVWKRQIFTDGTDEWVNSP